MTQRTIVVFLLGLSVMMTGGGCASSAKRVDHLEEVDSASLSGIPADSLGIKLQLQQHRLPNGLRVVLIEDHTVPIVSYQTWFKVGSVDERPGITGISHLFEHMMFKGTEKYGPKDFFVKLEAKGAEVNAFTTRDYTVYYENFVPTLLETVIEMESDRMENLRIDEKSLNTERLVVLEERRLRTENTPEGKMQEKLWELAYRRHPYRWPVIGYPQDLLALDVDTVNEYFRSHYQPENATLVIVGDIRPAETLGLVKKYYGSIPGRVRPERAIPEEPEQREERRLVIHDSTPAEKFTHAYHVTAAADEDTHALDVLSNILFAGTTSRAYRRLVEEKDVSLGIQGSAFTPAYPGLFLISATMKQGVPATRAEALLDEVLREIQENGVTEDEVKVAVKQLTVQLVDGVRTPYGMGMLVGTVQMIFGDANRYTEDFAKYLKVTPEDVKRVANRYLHPNNRSVVVLSRKEVQKGIER